jgi:BirA family transcriptional regulator, biotin operon repressor / biotin---[acetyl-CoA-carboxylase] ligase
MIHFVHYPSVDSTNTQAKRLFDAGESMPLCVVAETQTAGRGRTGRTWQSPVGGLWMSVAFAMSRPALAYAAVPVLAAICVRSVLQTLVRPGSDVTIKWPNDLLIDGAKVCGILCEQHLTNSPMIVIGVGINVDIEVDRLEVPLRMPATSLHLCGSGPVLLADLSNRLAEELIRRVARLEVEGPDAQTRALMEQGEADWSKHHVVDNEISKTDCR